MCVYCVFGVSLECFFVCLENKSPVAENTHKKSGNICKTHTLIFSKKESVFVAPFSFFLGHYSSNFVVFFGKTRGMTLPH